MASWRDRARSIAGWSLFIFLFFGWLFQVLLERHFGLGWIMDWIGAGAGALILVAIAGGVIAAAPNQLTVARIALWIAVGVVAMYAFRAWSRLLTHVEQVLELDMFFADAADDLFPWVQPASGQLLLFLVLVAPVAAFYYWLTRKRNGGHQAG